MQTETIKHQPYREIDPKASGARIGEEPDVGQIQKDVAWLMLPTAKKVKLLKEQQTALLNEIRGIKNRIVTEYQQGWVLELLIEAVEKQKLVVEKQINHYMWELQPDVQRTELNFARARSVPITDFIQFNRMNKAKCLWHDDNSPSMSYHKKRNKIHCFSCGADKDVIDVVQILNGYSVAEAVKFLTRT